jgi:hypothetical protein
MLLSLLAVVVVMNSCSTVEKGRGINIIGFIVSDVVIVIVIDVPST